ncbi:MAG: 23S rRNA (pseudouridine(1915)-N(3))-methyltransferase RlmH [Alphaproteobacteria bacterium]
MRLSIIAVGRLKVGPELELVENYVKRLDSAPARLGPLAVREIDERKDAETQSRALADLLVKLAPASKIVALDERGEALTTRAFTDRLASWRDDGIPEAAFLIGGADGLLPKAREGAHLTLSLGRLTFPHLFARALIAEQLYRAASLLSGHPYHRD